MLGTPAAPRHTGLPTRWGVGAEGRGKGGLGVVKEAFSRRWSRQMQGWVLEL